MMSTQKVPPVFAMNVALNITSIPAQEAFLVDAPTPTSPNPRWIQAKRPQPRMARCAGSRSATPGLDDVDQITHHGSQFVVLRRVHALDTYGKKLLLVVARDDATDDDRNSHTDLVE